jgi:hypothetical protein
MRNYDQKLGNNRKSPEDNAQTARAVALRVRDGDDVTGVACSGFAHLTAADETRRKQRYEMDMRWI